MKISLFLLLWLPVVCNAQVITKCTTPAGKVTYSDGPCLKSPGDKATFVDVLPITPAEVSQAQDLREQQKSQANSIGQSSQVAPVVSKSKPAVKAKDFYTCDEIDQEIKTVEVAQRSRSSQQLTDRKKSLNELRYQLRCHF